MHTTNRHAALRRVSRFRVFVFCLAFLACGRGDICRDPDTNPAGDTIGAAVSGATGLRGLWTGPDDLQAPEGSLTVADNLAFYRPGIAEPRRGEAWLSFTSIGGTIDALTEFQGHPVAHYGSTIKQWNGSAWVAYTGTYSPRSGKPARFFQSAGSLFFLSSAGVYELDAIGGTWRLTGAPKALQGSAALRRTTSETGFASANGQWAYRYVWGYINANNKLQLGAPSGRFILTNPANVVAAKANIDKPTGGSKTVRVQNTTHGFTTGDYVDVTLGGAEASYTAGRFQVTVVSATHFTYTDTGANGIVGNPTNDITYGYTSRNATLTVPIPAQITTSYFLQVYRSAKSADANSEPSDALAMVYEKSPTNLEIAAASMTVTDIAPDEVRAPALYTSLGEQSHLQPPACADAASFRDGTLYACTTQVQILEFGLLGVGGATGLQTTAVIAINGDPTNPNVAPPFAFVIVGDTAEDFPNGKFVVTTSGSVSQNIAATAKSIVGSINGFTGNTAVYAEYVSADTDPPGRVRLYARSPATAEFFMFAPDNNDLISPSAFTPTLIYEKNINTIGRSGSTVTVTFGTAHGFVAGQQVKLNGSNSVNFPDGLKTIATVPLTTSFTYTESGTGVAPGANDGAFYSQATETFRSNGSNIANSLMWAPPDEPWNVPAINFKIVGPSEATALALVTTRDRVLIYTDHGLFQGTGDGDSWVFTEFDTTLNLKAPRCAVSANGKAYGWFESGISEMVESARVTSIPIDKTLRDLLVSAPTSVPLYSFAVPYDSYRMVLFFLPTGNSDTAAKQVYVLHTDTGDWTGPWDLNAFQNAGPIAGAGMVSPTDGKLYISSGGYVAKERKAGTAADQVEALVPGILADVVDTIVSNTLSGMTSISALGSVAIGATLYDSTSGASSTITALDPIARTVTVASASGFSSMDSVTVVTGPLTSAIQPIAITEGDSGAQKVFSEGSLAFRHSEFTSGSLTFSTDLSPTFSAATTLVPPGGNSVNPSEIDFWVPQSWQRGTRLSWKFSHTGIAEWWGLQGWTVRARICSRRTTR